MRQWQQLARHAKRLYSPPWGSSSAIRSGSSSATRSDSSWETAGRASQHVKASEMRHFAATCKACKEIVLTSVGFFVGDSVGFFVGDSVGFFVGDCRKGIAARQGVRDEPPSSICIATCKACKEIVLTSVGFFVGDSVGFFVGDSVGFFVGDCRKGIAARQGVRDEAFAATCKASQRDCTHLRGVLRRRFGRVLRRRLGRILRGRLQEGHRSTSRRQRLSLHQAFAATCKACRRDCTHLRGVLRRRFGRVLRRRLGRILRGRLQEGHRSTSRRQR